MRTGASGVCGGAVDDLGAGTAGGLVGAAAVLIHLPASVASRGAALYSRRRAPRRGEGLVARFLASARTLTGGRRVGRAPGTTASPAWRRRRTRSVRCPLVGFLAGGNSVQRAGRSSGRWGLAWGVAWGRARFCHPRTARQLEQQARASTVGRSREKGFLLVEGKAPILLLGAGPSEGAQKGQRRGANGVKAYHAAAAGRKINKNHGRVHSSPGPWATRTQLNCYPSHEPGETQI